MGRRATRNLTWAFVLRTFKRVDMISARYSAEIIAKALVERGDEIASPEYLRDIWEYYARPQARGRRRHPCASQWELPSMRSRYRPRPQRRSLLLDPLPPARMARAARRRSGPQRGAREKTATLQSRSGRNEASRSALRRRFNCTWRRNKRNAGRRDKLRATSG
jgi:hypothetical protein